jgi:hypothetical protein
MWSVLLFADNRGDPLSQPEIIWGLAGITVALLAGAGVIYAVDKWRKRATAPDADETGSLTSFRAMYESGEITEAEYAELRRRVAEKVKKPAANGAAAAPAPAAQPGERPTANPPAPPGEAPESSPPPSTA